MSGSFIADLSAEPKTNIILNCYEALSVAFTVQQKEKNVSKTSTFN